IRSVAGGASHSVALGEDGIVWSWGWNKYGQLGDGDLKSRATPARVPGLPPIVQLATGSYHTLALAADGTLSSGAFNGSSQLADDPDLIRLVRARVDPLPRIAAIA